MSSVTYTKASVETRPHNPAKCSVADFQRANWRCCLGLQHSNYTILLLGRSTLAQ
jgi:hypothetical protein